MPYFLKMDILMLGGGYGTRLFGRYNPCTYYPKGLVDIGGKPIIEYVLETFSDDLIDRIIIETNKEGKTFYEDWLNNFKFRENTEIYVEEVSTPENCLGVLETIDIVSNHYKFSEPFLIISPDNLFIRNQNDLIINYNGGVRIATYEVESLDDAKKYGVVELELDKIISCIEKPLQPSSRIIRTSCEIWDEEVFSLLSEWNSNFDSDKVGNFINYLITKGINVESYKTNSLWIDIGNKQDLQKARSML